MLISDRVAELKLQYDRFTLLAKELPDIEIYQDRWKHEYYCSKSVNAIASDILFKRSCGCCSDCAILAHATVSINGVEVTTSPQTIRVAYYDDFGHNLYQDPTWRESAEKYGFNQGLISKMESYTARLPIKKADDADILNEFSEEVSEEVSE